METRKIQKVGGSTFTVSVPKEWAREEGLETGEAVRLYTHRDGSLIVRGRQTDGDGLESVSLPVTESSVDAVERPIQGAYETGFEQITLRATESFTDEQRRAARTIARRLVGTEVLAADADEIVVRAMLDASAVSVRQSIEQTVSVITTMQETVRESLTGETETSGRVGDRMADVTRLVALIRRHYNRSLVAFGELDALGIDRVALSQYHRAADRLEQIATGIIRLDRVIEAVEPEAEQARTVAELLTARRDALEAATKRVVEGDATAGQDVELSPIETGTEIASNSGHDDGVDPSLARLVDQLEQIDAAIRAIERIGLQSAIHPRHQQ
ncbi:Phosphate regulatory protein [Halorhabdus tiamatea SARL4B]|uniref:Phosphate regulatory protein n=1 Tax=Halorhabdus tiamatea SARL4B TaxID=1033806 RepID=F7PJC1_9EURY|nr:AbrB/MazE/SpoVT family DNA-binding domain-containing protein [Halorhabdus tiamatea]ERJ05463.1 Phosphate regulatory protein [Halorhabdus tiamatea SARL4B]CCQ33577.1 SpoVT/AbrB domain protein [Halorhabdus tiamatea SARL4B]